jgi:hypothetical protein
VSLTRSLRFVLLAFLILSSGAAFAGDYTVAYAFDTGDLIETGQREKCEYSEECKITLEKTELTIRLAFWHPDVDKVHVWVSDQRPGCCFFSDGVETVSHDARGASISLNVFEGRKRKRNEFIQNTPVGVLYLRFSDMK